jgi:acyl dehydratase
MTRNPQALHLDAAFSAGMEFGKRLVNSLLTISALVALSVAHLTQGTLVANLGLGDIRFPAPVHHGDTI